MINKFQRVISWIILICVAIFTTLVFFQMWHNLFKNYFKFEPQNYVTFLVVGFVLVVAAGVILYMIRDDIVAVNRGVLIILLIVFAIIAIVWVKSVPQTQISDFGNFWNRAPDALHGKPIYAFDNDYFAKWAYQTGFLVYVMAVIKIFGYHVVAIQYLNILYQVLILLVSYKLVVKIFDNIKMARITVLLLMVNLDWFALNSQADNQYIGSLLFLTTFLLILQDKYWAYALSGLTLALGAIVRPIGPVIIAGIVVFGIFYVMFKNNKFHLDAIWKFLIVLAIYFAIFSGAGMLIKSSGLNQYGLSNRDSEWKFVTGLDYGSNGTYDQKLVNKFDLTESRAKMSKQEHKVINQHVGFIKQDHRWFHLFYQKLSILWAERSSGIDFTSIETNHSQDTVSTMRYVGYIGSVITIIFSWIGSLRLFKFEFKNGLFLLLLPLMAFVVIQLVIEVQGRYRIEFIPVLAMLGGTGVVAIFDWFSSKVKHKTVNRI
ncbi:hypothetical protein [Companilactobacillus ginsenosidimutans]|uniref:Glycosyltransferase RgtA/B/C/D-like domain-containing protein n=1 Tax=Companilactobacillus ginsenosidimutans TaxID=1007676 RepID=A0A0H4R1J6_9LACO|nr:hypothetical protein [Companilactobacillus ginsenosidimutans]AKP67605.1 hypothetical protein ABM34_08720 [Companilactobacillus ginsenosidimutans]